MRIPALVIRGTEDLICRQDWAERFEQLLPNAELVLIPDAAHTVVFTHPEKLVSAARPFIV
ncbi:alpha/beta fold hydrolase [Nitrosospira sp. Nl5]|uniref:alpha/beta fold hydrolase n=1 Tax=Nitrosospira sp. Nl5 TaxID=200120 RepID=UPI000B86F488